MGAQIPTKHIHQCPVADSARPVLTDKSPHVTNMSLIPGHAHSVLPFLLI